jgi:hypothetical protein
MAKPLKTVSREIEASKTRFFSSFQDLAKVAVDSGIVSSVEDLFTPENREILGELLFEWYIQGQVACAFAQILAKQATKDGEESTWETIVTDSKFDIDELQEKLLTKVKTAEAVQIIFLGSPTADYAVEIIKALCEHESWICYEKGWKKGEEGKGDALLVGLRWNPPGTDYASWVLGIADFDPMAFTRRFVGAPFIALVLRPGPPVPKFAEVPQEGKLKGSHLAHMDSTIESKELFMRTRAVTEFNKDSLLGHELRSHARAQTTFALPQRCREGLGEVLRKVDEN